VKRLFAVVRWVLAVQFLAIVAITLLALILGGGPGARSAFLGGLAAFLPNACFAARFGVSDPGKTTKDIVRTFYIGETIKLTTTAALLIVIFQLPGIVFLPLFAGFAAVPAVYWFALLVRDTEI